MAAAKEEKHGGGADEGTAKPRPPLAMVVVLLNTVILLAGIGTLVYTKLIFKRPRITETAERDRLAALATLKPKAPRETGLVNFESISVNISPTVLKGQNEEGSQALKNKLHFITIGIAVEFSDASQQMIIEEMKPYLTDQLISLVGKQDFYELNTVHGRYLLRSQIIEAANELLKKATRKTDLIVTNIYLNEFMIN